MKVPCLLAAVLVFALGSSSTWAAIGGGSAGQCPSGPLVSSKIPLAGLWRVSGYREITGQKHYATAGDAVLIVPTANPDEVCVEFTLPVEGSQHFFLAVEADGQTIDETVYPLYGGELRVIFRYRSADSVHFVLYNRPLTGIPGKGGTDEGGAVGDLENWD
ncbi:MAG: hypothetical protein KDI71_11655 [Xanthomonadales bacterium]|nr:hypothetical protein [Xanthomonadales bacterium]